MKRNIGWVSVAALMSLLMLSLSAGKGRAHEVLDPMVRPALMSRLATKSVLLAVTAAGKRLVAVGEHGIIVLSDNHGDSWYQARVPVSVTLTAVFFVSPEKGWALGHSGVVLHSDDGGITWEKQLDGRRAAQLALQAAQAKEKAAGTVTPELKRQLSAAKLLVKDGPDKPFLNLYFENEQRGFIIGAYNLIFHTEDGGKTWQPWLDHVDNPRGMHLYGICPEGHDFFMAGEKGLILRSVNRGQTFTTLKSPYDGSFFGLISLSDGELLVFGLRGHAFKSVDFGNTWKPVRTGNPYSISAATQLQDGTLLLITVAGDVLASKDKGKTFKEVQIKDSFPFADLIEAKNGNLVLVGMRGVQVVPMPCRLTSLK